MTIFDALNILILSLQTVALLFIAMSLLKIRRDNRYAAEWNKRTHTLSAINLSPASRNTISMVLGRAYPVETLLKDNEFRSQILSMLNEIEQLCLGIITDAYDEEIIKLSLEQTFLSVFRELSGFIIQDRNSEKPSNAFISFETTIRKWGAEKHSNRPSLINRI